MDILNENSPQVRLCNAILTDLERVGYRGGLVEKSYSYPDRFSLNSTERLIQAALFGREPASYETATIGVVIANGVRDAALVNMHRSLGAPIILEIQDGAVGVWTVAREEANTQRQLKLEESQFHNWVGQNNKVLNPREFLRLKDLGNRPIIFQRTLFAGLIPELEERIVETLDPILEAAFSSGVKTYEKSAGVRPSESDLFKLSFWLLTGKVFADRGHREFAGLKPSADPDEVLSRVANHYGERIDHLLNRETREAVFERIWDRMDFRHLSVEVLSQIWSRTLVTPQTRKRLGIHRTRRSIVRYLVGQIPFEAFDREDCRVLEPCSGSATFLIGAMDRMRDIHEISDPVERHAYFQRMLTGIEQDPFGVEIGRLCLALSDYPNPDGWNIAQADIFQKEPLPKLLTETRIVLSNPPFEKFSQDEKQSYESNYWYKPAELLFRVLRDLHREGVIGFVMPKAFLDGQDYRDVRELLVRRFNKVDLVSLPDNIWDVVKPETVLLTATEPNWAGSSSVTHAVVRSHDWEAFEWTHTVSSRDTANKTAEEAPRTLAVPELREIWEFLAYCPTLREVADPPHRGVEWKVHLKTHEEILVRNESFPDSKRGVPPNAKIDSFQQPIIKYLNFSKEYRLYNAFELPWDRPKVIIGKARRSLQMWRVSAFADFDGLACYQTFIALWPKQPFLTVPIAAVLNGPVANAFLTTHSTRESFSHETIKCVPFPLLSERQIDEIGRLVLAYQNAVSEEGRRVPVWRAIADGILRQLDAVVLEAYGLPPRLERQLLDAFIGSKRVVPFEFEDYFPRDFTPYFTLKEWLTERPALSTVGRFRSKSRDIPDHIKHALEIAGASEEESEN